MTQAFFNEDAERSVLAAFITDQVTSAKLIPQLAKDDFYLEDHKKIFAALQALYSDHKPIDFITLSDMIKSMYGDADNKLLSAAMDIVTVNQFGASWAVKSHVEIIKAAALRRRFLSAIETAQSDILDDSNDTAAVIDKTRQTLRELIMTGHTWMSMQNVLVETYTAIQSKATGQEKTMPSGISSIDTITDGFHKGELTIIGARPAVGKSAFGAHIALSVAAKGYKVGVCSREMTAVQYGMRILSRGADVDSGKIRAGNLNEDEWESLADAIGAESHKSISFIFSTRYIEDLRMEVQKQVDAGELDMLVVDYVQLMQTRQRFDKDYLRIAYVSKALKDMTTDLNISVIALAQVGRSSEGTMPTLAELRGSGDLEQDADNVMFIHRPASAGDKYINPSDRAMFDELKRKGLQYLAVNVAKQRQGLTGTVPIIFNPSKMRYTAIDRAHKEGARPQ